MTKLVELRIFANEEKHCVECSMGIDEGRLDPDAISMLKTTMETFCKAVSIAYVKAEERNIEGVDA